MCKCSRCGDEICDCEDDDREYCESCEEALEERARDAEIPDYDSNGNNDLWRDDE